MLRQILKVCHSPEADGNNSYLWGFYFSIIGSHRVGTAYCGPECVIAKRGAFSVETHWLWGRPRPCSGSVRMEHCGTSGHMVALVGDEVSSQLPEGRDVKR